MQATGRWSLNKSMSARVCHVLKCITVFYVHLHASMTDITKTTQWQRTWLCSLITHLNIWLLTAYTSAKRDPLFNTQTWTVLMLQARRLPNCHCFARLIGRAALKQAQNSFKVGEEQVMSLFMLVINRSLSHSATKTRKS